MIYFPKEGGRYKIGLNIKIFKRIFLKITLLSPIPLFSYGNYRDFIRQDYILRGWRIYYVSLSYTRFWNDKDIISFNSYFKPIGKEKIVQILDSHYKRLLKLKK